jgi:hypothetical protein
LCRFVFSCCTLGWNSVKSGHILRRNCLLQRVTEGKIQGWIEVTGRQGRRCRKLFDDLKERRGYSHMKEEALDRTMWRAHFGKGFGPVVRQTTRWMNEWILVKLSTGVVCCYALGFIYLRAGCYVFLQCINSSMKRGFWKTITTLEVHNKF